MKKLFDRLAAICAKLSGHPTAFLLATLIIIVWAATGPVFHFSDTWQLVINTGTTIVTFLMVFLLQAAQLREALAIHAKLDELIRVNREARNELIGAEERGAEEIIQLKEAPNEGRASRS